MFNPWTDSESSPTIEVMSYWRTPGCVMVMTPTGSANRRTTIQVKITLFGCFSIKSANFE